MLAVKGKAGSPGVARQQANDLGGVAMKVVGEPALDDLNRQLAAIQDRLLELAPDDFAEKYRLRSEQDRLRVRTREYARDRDAGRTSEDLLAELDARVSALDTIRKQMLCLWSGVQINLAMRAASGTDQLIQRTAHLETILKERGDL